MSFINERTAKFYQINEYPGKLLVTNLDEKTLRSMYENYKYQCKYQGTAPILTKFKCYFDEQNIYNSYLRILTVTDIHLD